MHILHFHCSYSELHLNSFFRPNTTSFHSSPHTSIPTGSGQALDVDHVLFFFSHCLHPSPQPLLISSILMVSYNLQDSRLVHSSTTLPCSTSQSPVVSVISSLTTHNVHPMKARSKIQALQQPSLQSLLTSLESTDALLTT